MPKTETQPKEGLKRAPSPGGNFVKLAVGMSVHGTMVEARMEIEKKKDKKGKITDKERYHFSLKLAGDSTFIVGKVKHEKEQAFNEGDVVTIPDHGYLVTTLRRTACEIAGKPYVPNEDTDLTPLVGQYFEITRREDGEISSGEWAGKSSALYDIFYGATPPQA